MYNRELIYVPTTDLEHLYMYLEALIECPHAHNFEVIQDTTSARFAEVGTTELGVNCIKAALGGII